MQVKGSSDEKLLYSCLGLMTALNNGLKDFIGTAARGVIFNTGLGEGYFLGKNFKTTKNIEEVIEVVNQAFEGVWRIDLFKAKNMDDFFYKGPHGYKSVNIVVRECPIRQSVLSYNLEQGGSICYLTNGYICGIIGQIMNCRCGMDMLHHGPNACLKRLFFRNR